MRRRYTISEYMDFVQLAHESVDSLYLGTDIMVGFPVKPKENFKNLQRISRKPFRLLPCFSFSEREGTVAARRDDQVPVEERQHRSAYLRDCLQKRDTIFTEPI